MVSASEALEGNLPVPRNRREENSLPAITSGSVVTAFLTPVCVDAY
jgi:hypothetical protein